MKFYQFPAITIDKKHHPDSGNNSNLAACLLWIDGTNLPAWAKKLPTTISLLIASFSSSFTTNCHALLWASRKTGSSQKRSFLMYLSISGAAEKASGKYKTSNY